MNIKILSRQSHGPHPTGYTGSMPLSPLESPITMLPCPQLGNPQGASFILSGGADGDIRLWGAGKISKSGKASATQGGDGDTEVGRYQCKRRLSGHYRSATCVFYGRLELVSGHEDGEIHRKKDVVLFAKIQYVFLPFSVSYSYCYEVRRAQLTNS